MSEEAGSSSCFLQRPPVAILRAIVQRDGFLCSGGDPGQSLCNGSASRSSALGGQLVNEHQARLPFNQRVDARCMVATLHRVALPVSDAGTGLYHSRTRLNGRALGLRYSLASSCEIASPMARLMVPAICSGERLRLSCATTKVRTLSFLSRSCLPRDFLLARALSCANLGKYAFRHSG